MKLRSRDAWLATIAAALGTSAIACNKDAKDGPAAVREVPSASASATIVASSAPSETASAEVVASASAAPPPSASTAPTAQTVIGLQNIGSIGHGACGGSSRVNPICGATANRPDPVVAVALRATADEKDTTTLQAQLRPRLRNCASTTAKRDPNLHGELTLQIAIDAHGGVTNVDVEGYSIDETTVQCMRSAARSTKFAEGAARRVRVVIRLQAS